MASMLGYFKNRSSFGKGCKKQGSLKTSPSKMICFLGLKSPRWGPASAETFFSVNSPILRMLFHEKVFKPGKDTTEPVTTTSRIQEATTEPQGQEIGGLPDIKAEEVSKPEEEKQVCNLPQADESSPDAEATGSDAGDEEDDNIPREKKWYDDISGLSSCWTQAAEILDDVLYGGEQPCPADLNLEETDSENPIPPEYEEGTELLRAALQKFPMPPHKIQSNTRYEPPRDPPGYKPPRLTAANLNKHLHASWPAAIKIPSRPYRFMKNPRHEDPYAGALDPSGGPLACWDGCPDCEVHVAGHALSVWLVNQWFEKHFTHHDMYQGDFGKNPSHPSLMLPDNDPDDEVDSGNIMLVKRPHDEDFLMGAEGGDDFHLYKQAWYSEPQDTHQSIVTLLVQYMQVGADIGGCYHKLSYYHGERFDAILACYEPRLLPNIGFGFEDKLHVIRYPTIEDMSKPIWEARGCPFPMQGDFKTRMQYAKREYDRQWLMYHARDDAHLRYVQQVKDAAQEEYVRRGLLVLPDE